MWKPDVIIYHFPCDDGFASAWVARQRWPDIELWPCNYGQAFPMERLRDCHVLVADFSFGPQVLAEMVTVHGAKSIVLLDHHKTAEADLAPFAVTTMNGEPFQVEQVDATLGDLAECQQLPILAYFDMRRSGAVLTWQFANWGAPAPMMLRMIEDRDLWRFELRWTRAFSLFLRSFDYEMAVWDEIARRVAAEPQLVDDESAAIERYYDRRIAEMVPTATLRRIGRWDGVPVAFAPYAFASDLAHELLKKYPAAPFAAVAVDAYGGRTWSLRSEDSRQDVSEVARLFGGGGHRNSAGFRSPI